MKPIFRTVTALLSLLLCLALTACDLPPQEAANDGKTLTVKTSVGGAETFRPEAGASVKTDEILAMIEAAEAKGYTVDVQFVAEASLDEDLIRAGRTETKYADLIQSNALLLTKHYRAGNLISLADAQIEESETGVLRSIDGTAFAFRADGWINPLPTLSHMIVYNESLFTDLGCETPMILYEDDAWDWVNFEKLCYSLCSAKPGEVFATIEPTAAEPELIWALLYASGAEYFDPTGVCTMDSLASRQGFDRLRLMKENGYLYKTASVVNDSAYPNSVQALIHGKIAMVVGNSSVFFDTSESSASAVLGEGLRILPFPGELQEKPLAAFAQDDLFLGVTEHADLALCKTLFDLLFTPEEGTDPYAEFADTYFFHEEDAAIYREYLQTAGSDTSLWMTDNRALVEDHFVQVANGRSPKEVLYNLQQIFNCPTKG